MGAERRRHTRGERTRGQQHLETVRQAEASLAGIVEDRDGVSGQTWLQRLWFDVVKTILAGSTLSGLVSAVRLGDELTTDEGTLAPRAAFVQAVSIDCSETMDTD